MNAMMKTNPKMLALEKTFIAGWKICAIGGGYAKGRHARTERAIFNWTWHNCNRCGSGFAFARRALLRRQVKLHDIAAEQQRHRPIDHDAHPPAPLRHPEKVVAPPNPPSDEAA